MRIITLIITLSFLFIVHSGAKGKSDLNKSTEGFILTEFDILPPSPGAGIQPGLAGAFSGVIDNNLIIAGGANFPGDLPWKGGVKQWHRDIYLRSLDSAHKDWKVFPDLLPQPLAYGYSVSLPQGLLCIGGCNDEYISGEVFLIRYVNDSLAFETWPSLPVPLAYMAGALIDDKIYIAGGQEEIKQGPATNHFFSLDIQNMARGWETLSSWPGPPRAFAVAAGQSDGFDNCFYLFSGRNFSPDHPVEVLNDGYAYNPRMKTWKKLDTPEGPLFPVMAGTAVSSGANHIIFFGGSDGKMMMKEFQIRKQLEEYNKQLGKLVNKDSVSILQQQIAVIQDNHPGFSKDILLFHTITNTVIIHSVAPFPLPVTTNIVNTGNKFLIISGEISPGIRTPMILSAESATQEKTFGFLNSAVIFIYFVVLVIMGWHFSRKQKSANDYFRAGGRLPWWAVGLSIFGTALSAITFMSIPAKAYASDWSYIFFNFGIVAVAPIIILLFIPFYRKLNITTAYEYLEQRFNTATRVITSISYIFFQIGRMGIVLFLPSIALNVVTGIDIFLCITLMGVFSLIYTMMGGIEAVVWTDALQVVVLLGGAILAVILISLDVKGGFTGIIAMGTSDGKFNLPSVDPDLTNPTLITVLIATLFTNLTTYGTDQTIVQRYLTTSTEKMAAKSVWTNALLTIPSSLIFFFVGTALYVYFKENPVMLSPSITDQDAIFPWYIFTQMPPGVCGLLIAGIFAAAMSTLSASMNSSATAYLVDIHFRFGWSKDMKGLKLPRIATLVLGLAGISFAFMMATIDIKSLWDEFNKILGLILGSLGGLFLLGMLTRKANGAGAIIGIICSILVQIWVSKTQAVHLLLYASTGFISCFISGYIASLFFPGFNKKTDHLTIYRNKT